MTETPTQHGGAATGWPLDDLTPLTRPWRPDPWGCLRPQPTEGLLRLAAELAHTAYTMDVTPWLRAGWRDVTIQLDGDLTDGIAPVTEGRNALERFLAAWKLRRIQAKLKQRKPLGQMLGAVRQIRSSDTGKAVVLLHPLPDGRYAVAIGFMGTGGQAYDWISNFRISAEEGTHRGFLQLCRQFEANEEEITFPQTAAEMGLEKLTLRQILAECAHENSRFLLFLAGHSQGAAVLQVWTRRKLEQDGVLPRSIIGCGFASPSVVTGDAVRTAGAYPLLHLVSSEDLVPRMGAMVHLGELLLRTPDEAMRRACYGWPMDGESCRRRAMVRNVTAAMTDTPASLAVLAAYLRLLSAYPVETIMENLRFLQSEARPVRKLAGAVDAGVDSLLAYLVRRCEAACLSISGRPLNPVRVARMERHLAYLAARMGLKGVTETLAQLGGGPHTMVTRRGAELGAYPYLTLHGMEDVVCARWMTGRRPVLIWEDGGAERRCQHRWQNSRRTRRLPHRSAPRERQACRCREEYEC